MIRLFKVFIPVGTLTLLVTEAVLVTSAFIFATYLALEVDPTVFLLCLDGQGQQFLCGKVFELFGHG